LITPELSKKVGWKNREVKWPESVEEVRKASDEQILEWYRFLPSPRADDKEKQSILLAICEELWR
jgi:hypothetical protein